jgi:phage shock protein C
MYCTSCGTEQRDVDRFCSACGKTTGVGGPVNTPPLRERRLTRSLSDKKIAGVCAGLAHYFELDPTLVRLIWLSTVIFAGTGLLAYLIAWIVMPKEERPLPVSGVFVQRA